MYYPPPPHTHTQVFVCCDPEDFTCEFKDSEMNRVIDRHANSILLHITVPPPQTTTSDPDQGSLTLYTYNGYTDSIGIIVIGIYIYLVHTSMTL